MRLVAKELMGLVGISLFAFSFRMLFLCVPAFQSDESIYTYASYALSQGLKPYTQIFLAHGPLTFELYSGFIKFLGPNLIYTRTLNILIFLPTILLTYYFGKLLLSELLDYNTTKIRLACAGSYAFYPLTLQFSMSSPIVNLFTLCTLCSALSYVAFLRNEKKCYAFLSGIFAGLALMTWYIGFFFSISIILFEILRSLLKGKRFWILIERISIITVGMSVSIMTFLSWICFVNQSFQQFYLQTFVLQLSRASMTFSQKWAVISTYLTYTLVLIVFAIIGAAVLIRYTKKKPEAMLALWLFVINFFLLAFPRTTLLHYFLYLTPYIVILSVIGFFSVIRFIIHSKKASRRRHTVIVLLFSTMSMVILTATSAYVVVTAISPFYSYFSHGSNPYTKTELYIGSYIANITQPCDKIWTSEPAIAFFANRLIVAPKSDYWPFHGFFNDVFDTEYVDMFGVTQQGLGIVEPDQFLQAWTTENVTVLVFIRGLGPVPYPDQFLWFGYRDQEGVKSWVESNYELRGVVFAQDVTYTYEVWVKK